MSEYVYLEIEGYVQVSPECWRQDYHQETLHVIRQWKEKGLPRKEVIYFIKEEW